MFRIVLTFLWVLLKIALRRVFKGPLLSSWNYAEETLIALGHAYAHRIRRKGIRALTRPIALLNRPPRAGTGVRIQPVDVSGIPGFWFHPADVGSDAVLLYLHGGGYVTCSVTTHEDLLNRLCRAARCRILAVDYRLAPQHPFPAALDDAVTSYQWLLGQGVAAERIAVAGDSAGGGLTLALLLALRDRGLPLPASAVCLSPWTDLASTGSTEANYRTDYIAPDLVRVVAPVYAGTESLTHPLVSPLYGDPRGLPPLLIQVGGAEVLLDDARRFTEKARGAGVEVTLEVTEEMFHVFQAFALIEPRAKVAIARMGEFIQQQFARAQRRAETREPAVA